MALLLDANIKSSSGGIKKASEQIKITSEVLNPSDLAKVKYCRKKHAKKLIEFYGVDRVDALSDTQIIQYIKFEGKFTAVGLLDINYYRVLNPDLEAAGLSDEELIAHFEKYGIREERNFNPTINLKQYKELNADLANFSSEELFNHLITFGFKERRKISLSLDLSYYQRVNPDLAEMDGKALYIHLTTFGLKELRKFSPLIDLRYYQAQNPDLAGMTGEQLMAHLVTFGLKEFRKFSPFCDLKFYQRANADLAGMNGEELFKHLITFGLKEQRQFSAFIDLKFYKQSNPDLAGMEGAELLEHLIEFGLKEARSFSPLINLKAYKEMYGDAIAKFFGINIGEISLDLVFQFMISAGLQQGISPSPLVDISFFIGKDSDELSGGTGNDIIGGTGNDLTGGTGNDLTGGVTEPMPEFPWPSPTPSPVQQPPAAELTPTPFFNLGFIVSVKTYLEKLKVQFPNIDFSNLKGITPQQLEEIKNFVIKAKINPAPFIDVNDISVKLKDVKIKAKLLATGKYTEAQLANLSGEAAATALLEVGESPSKFVNFKFILKNPKLASLVAKFTVNGQIDYKGLFEYVTVGEGATQGLELSPFFSPKAFKAKYLKELSKYVVEKFGASEEKIKDAATFTNEQILAAAQLEKAADINVKYGLYKYSIQIAKFFKDELGLTDSEIVPANSATIKVKIENAIASGKLDIKKIESYLLLRASDQEFSLSEINYKALLKDETIKVKLKLHFFGSETVDDAELEKISEVKIKGFLKEKAFKLKLDLTKFVDVNFYKETFKVQLKNAFGLADEAAVATLDANKIARFILDKDYFYVDTDYYVKKYGLEQAEGGKLVKDLDDEELRFHIFGKGWKANAKLSPFKIKEYVANAANKAALLEAYGVTNIEELSEGQIVAFIKGKGLKKGLKIDAFLDATAIEDLKTTYKAEIASYFGIDVTAVANLSANLVFDFKYGGFSKFVDYDYVRFIATKENLKTAAGVAVATLSNIDLLKYIYEEFSAKPDFFKKLSAIDIEGFLSVEKNVKALKEYFGVEDVEKIEFEEIRKFICGEAVEKGLDIKSFIDLDYVIKTYWLALASDEKVLSKWLTSLPKEIDVAYIRYQIQNWIGDGTLTLQKLIDSKLIEAGTTIDKLSDAEIVKLSFSEEFKKLLGSTTLQLSGDSDVTYLRKTFAAAIASEFGLHPEYIVVKDEKITDLFAGKFADLDVAYIRYQIAALVATGKVTLQEVNGYLGSNITNISQLTDKQVIDLAFKAEFKTKLGKENAIKLSPFDYKGYALANEKAIKAALEITDVNLLTNDQIKQFAFTIGLKQGISLKSLLDFDYISKVYSGAIAWWLKTDTNSQLVLDWFTKEFSKLDVKFVGYQIDKWIDEGKLTKAEVAGFLKGVDAATFDITKLSELQILQLAFNAEFENLLKAKGILAADAELQLSAIDIDAYIEENALKLADFYMNEVDVNKEDDDDNDDDDDGSTDSNKDDDDNDSAKTDVVTDDKKIEFAKKLTYQQVIDYMFDEGWVKEGIDPTKYVNVEYLRNEYAAKIATDFKIDIKIVKDKAQFTDALILDWKFGGLSKYIDKKYLEKVKGITADADWKIVKLAYEKGLKAADVSPFDIKGYTKKYLKELAKELKLPFGQLKKLDKEEIDAIKEFALDDEKGLKLLKDAGKLDVFFKVDYFRNQKAAEIAFNYNVENAFSAKATQKYITGEAYKEGLEASLVIDKEWYKTKYAADIEANKATIDVNGNGKIEDGELVDYITGEGLEKGNNPSKAIDFATYRAEGSASAKDLLTAYGATSIKEISYSQTLAHMLTVGVEKGYVLSPNLVDLQTYKAQYGAEIAKQFNVADVASLTNEQVFQFQMTTGLEIGINPYVV
ncbi:MAG: hypothetical protein N3E45_13855 [Oscillatoriaceae bacterium SKW80]|nr:hypothetical protein [Oscillatoriaceae bacterium SKW80]